MTPESIAKELHLKYIGKTTLLEDCPVCGGTELIKARMDSILEYDKCLNCTGDGEVEVTLYQFNVPDCNYTTIAVWELSELESKLKATRLKFRKVEKPE